jgi:hypothetical protein
MVDNCFCQLFHKTSLNNELRCLTQYSDSYGPDDQGIKVTFPTEMRFSFSVQRPDQLCGPTSLLSNGYWRIFFWGQNKWAMILIQGVSQQYFGTHETAAEKPTLLNQVFSSPSK